VVQRIHTCPDPGKWLRRIAKFLAPEGDCWRWTGQIGRNGYGLFHWVIDGKKRGTGAHRASWLAHRGDIPDGLELDHLCRNHWCVNPWHMEPVTHLINVQRGMVAESARSRKGRRKPRDLKPHTCRKHGREDGYDSLLCSGYNRWVCRICNRERAARRETLRLAS
jgi:hypothetical protein